MQKCLFREGSSSGHRRPYPRFYFCRLAGLFALPSLAVSAASTITALGVLPNKSNSTAADISDDGQVVVGSSTDITGVQGEAFRWTPAGGMTGLGFLPGGSTSFARAVSKDGTTIVGDATSTAATPTGGTEAFRWRDGAMAGLHGLSQGFAVTADGSAVVDSNSNLRWTLAGGVEQNAVLYSGHGMSDDGSVIVGASSGFAAQRWTAATGPVNLPVPGPGAGVANAVTGDGQIAVGNFNNVACYWSQATGFVRIGQVGVISTALAVNRDGTVIVGRANIGAGGTTAAFVWTPTDGMRQLSTILTAQGVDLSAWLYKRVPTLVEATGITADGRYLVGNGTKQGFIVKLELASTLSPIEQWRQTNFGSTADAGNAADVADPDGDGVPNLLEFALGSSPVSAVNTGVPAARIVNGFLALGFNRINDPALTYTVEAATTLNPADWSPIWTSTGSANVAGHVDVSDLVPLSAQPGRYLRLKVSR
jgi:probable HAF family extracellular repeat protein